MSYFPVAHGVTGGEIDDFDDCDPTHYAGGYDIDLTYGRSLPPSYETCYPYKSSASDHPQFASHSKPPAYSSEAPGNEHNSFPGQKFGSGPPASAHGRGYGGPKPNYGFQPGGGVSEHGGRNQYARPDPGYSMTPDISNYGSSHGRSSDPSLMPGRKPDYGESGYGPKPASDFGGSRYESGGWPEKPTFPKPSYPEPSYPRPYPGPSFPMPSYPEPNYPTPNYPEPSYPMPSHPEPRYPAPGYGLQKYEHDNSDYERRKHDHSHHHGRHH